MKYLFWIVFSCSLLHCETINGRLIDTVCSSVKQVSDTHFVVNSSKKCLNSPTNRGKLAVITDDGKMIHLPDQYEKEYRPLLNSEKEVYVQIKINK